MNRLRSRFMRKDDELVDHQRSLIDDGSPTKGGIDGANLHGDDANALRMVHIVDHDRNAVYQYCDNTIVTASYSLLPLSLHFVLYKNLFEQFQKAANVYFLCISIMQVIPGLSPTGQYTTLLPLCIVVFLTLIKDFWEDWKRRTLDRVVNNKRATVYRGSTWRDTIWSDVQVGDLVLLRKNDSVPCDIISIWSSEAEGNCYIETASLDGETNLKLRKSTQALYHQLAKLDKDAEGRPSFKPADVVGRIMCETPNIRLYNFTGVIERERQPRVPLGPDNVLLRGSDVRNVKLVIGVAVFTGEDSKLAMNMTSKHHKMSRVDGNTNRQIFFVFIMQLVLSVICTVGYRIAVDDFQNSWFLAGLSDKGNSTALQFVTFIILYNSFIPISLYIMMEVVKVIQASLINNDIAMYAPATDTAAQVRNSKINEEFGQVEYIFSDKTGTLTCNRMEFRKFSVSSTDATGTAVATSYGEAPRPTKVHGELRFFDSRVSNSNWMSEANRDDIRRLLEAMAVCNTAIPEVDGSKVSYQAASPDEGCLVQAARELGVEMISRTERTLTLRNVKDNTTQVWSILHVIEFSSARKRMSVICKDPYGRMMVLTKGADNVILKALRRDPTQSAIHHQTSVLLNKFATDGLRTLVYAKLDITDDVFRRWKKRYDNVPLTDNREQRLDEIAQELESDMQLIGSTAIEDRLQDQVPETIELLARAGMKLWVLTGDKQETALNIAFSCNLLNKDMGLFTFDQCNADNIRSALEKYMSDVESAALEAGQDVGLIIEGNMLEHVLPKTDGYVSDDDEVNADLFVSLAIKCKTVICCRVSPIQKAKIVEAVKSRVSGVTLAIGDGANDVSMIQMAHVGIGISGVEGLQAARVSDCSVSQFSFLQRLLLVHGRWNYRRVARLIIFTFYKNMALYMTQFWFAFYNQFSGQTLYDAWALSMYNLAFSALPIMSLAVFDKDVEGKRLLHLTQFPELYSDGMKGRLFNTKEFWKYSVNAVLHSLVCFFLTIYAATDLVDVDTGTELGMVGHAIVAYSIILNVVTLKCALEVNTWTILNVLVFWLSIFFWYLFLLVYCILFRAVTFNDFASWYGADTITLRHPCYWLIQLVVVVVCLMRDAAYKYWRKNYEPRLSHVVQEFENRVGTFSRNQVKRETPWLFPKREIKAFKPTLTSSTGTDRFVEMEPINLEQLASQSSFFSPEQVSPGRRKKKISDIIDSCDI